MAHLEREIWSTCEEHAISVSYAISVITPERYANSVPGAQQTMKNHAISVRDAISVMSPESYAISVAGAQKQGKANVAAAHWPDYRPTYHAISVSCAIGVGTKTQAHINSILTFLLGHSLFY